MKTMLRGLLVLVVAGVLSGAMPVSAGSKTWNGSMSGLWGLASNWIPAGVPLNGDALIFPASATRLLTTNLAGGPTNFSSITFSGNGYSLRSPLLTITNGLTNATTLIGANTIIAPLRLGGNSTWVIGARNSLTVASNLTVSSVTITGVIGGSLIFDGNINGSASSGFQKNGNGRVEFNGSTTLASVDVNDGTLTVNGQLNGVLRVLAGATLNGGGSVPAFTCAGTVDPGSAASRRLTVLSGAPNFQTNSALRFALDGTVPGASHDQLSVPGPFDLSNVTPAFTLGFTSTAGTEFVIITNSGAGSFSSVFPGLPEGETFVVGGLIFTITYSGGTGNDVVIRRVLTSELTREWVGEGRNNLWSNPQNWAGNAVPVPTDILVFPGAASRKTNVNDLVFTNFTGITFSGAGYQLLGNPVALLAEIAVSANNGENSVGLPVFFTGPTPRITVVTGTTTLRFTAGVATPVDLLVASRALVTFASPLSGSGGLIVDSHGGTVTLSDANTYLGITEVRAGKLSLGASGGLGAAAARTEVRPGAVLELNGGITVTESLELAGTLANGADENTWGGNVSLSAAGVSVHVPDGSLTFAGIVSGTFGFNKTGIQPLVLTASNTFRGATRIGSGVVRVEGGQPASVVELNGGQIAGHGTVGEIRRITSGSVAPGSSVGPITTSNLVWGAGVTLLAEADNNDVNVMDFIAVRGGVQLNEATLQLLLRDSFVPAVGETFTLIENDGVEPVVGTFAGLPDDAVFSATNSLGTNFHFRISYRSGTGNDVTLRRMAGPSVFRVWSGGANNGFWASSANWVNGVPVNGDSVYFPNPGPNKINTNNIPNLRLERFIVGFGSFELHGATVDVADRFVTTNRNFIFLGIRLVGDAVIFSDGLPSLGHRTEMRGALHLNGHTATFECAGSGIHQFGPITGSGSVLKIGDGALVLEGPNSFTGPFEATSGIVEVMHHQAFGDAGSGAVFSSLSQLLIGQLGGPMPEPLTITRELMATGVNTISGPVHFASSNALVLTANESVSLTLQGTLTGGGFRKGEPGTLVLAGDSPTLGRIRNAGGGRLLINGTVGGAVDLSAGEVGGNGTVGLLRPDVSPGDAVIAPGFGGVDTLTLGGLSAASGWTAVFDVDRVSNVPVADKLRVNGLVSLNGASLQLVLNTNAVPPPRQNFVLIENDGSDPVNGTFAGITNGATILVPVPGGTVRFFVRYDGGDGNDVTLTRLRDFEFQPAVSVGGSLGLLLNGEPGDSVIVEVTGSVNGPSGVSVWIPVATNSLDSRGVLQYIELVQTNLPRRFFRARLE